MDRRRAGLDLGRASPAANSRLRAICVLMSHLYLFCSRISGIRSSKAYKTFRVEIEYTVIVAVKLKHEISPKK